MNIISANEKDIDELTQVEIESKKKSIPECIEDYEIDYASRNYRWQTYFKGQGPQTARAQRLILKAVDSEGKIIGYLAGHLTTRYDLDAEIQSFYVLNHAQRQKVGTKLLTEFVKWLIQLEAQSLCVGFNPKNKYKAFYLKHGGKYLNDHWIYWQETAQLSKNLTPENENTSK